MSTESEIDATAPHDGSDPGDPSSARVRRRPDGVSDELVAAIGKASEALECLERARGHLYSFHQLMGHADLTFGEAAELLGSSGEYAAAEVFETDVVGRNVLQGRWSFQIVEEFDDVYYEPVRDRVKDLERRHLGGMRHLYESEMKERRRTHGRPGHEARPQPSEPPEDPGPTTPGGRLAGT